MRGKCKNGIDKQKPRTNYFSLAHALPIEVERLEDELARHFLVDDDVANAAQEGETDAATGVLLVVGHALVDRVVIAATEGEGGIARTDEMRRGAQIVGGEAAVFVREVEFADEAGGDGMAVEDGTLAGEGEALEGVADGVAEVERLTDALFGGILLHDARFDGDGTLHLGGIDGEVAGGDVDGEEGAQVVGVGDEAVLDHLGEAGEEVVAVEGAEEGAVDHHAVGLVEGADLVLEAVEVDARLSAHGGVDGGHEGGGDVKDV